MRCKDKSTHVDRNRVFESVENGWILGIILH